MKKTSSNFRDYTMMFAIFNKLGERMYQYPTFDCEDLALKCLRRAREDKPQAGFHLQPVEE